MQQITRKFIRLSAWLALAFCLPAWAAAPNPPLPIKVMAEEGFNLRIVDTLADSEGRPSEVILRETRPAHDWFAVTMDVTHMPKGVPITFGLSLAGEDTPHNTADVHKWRNLRPVISISDPAKTSSYEYYTRDAAGHWRSSDLFIDDAARDAGTGTLPDKLASHPERATPYLTDDGKTWQAWRTVEAEVEPTINVFRVQQTLDEPALTLAMRVPFPYFYQNRFFHQLQAQAERFPGVTVDTVGRSPEGRALQVLRFDPPHAAPTMNRPTILAYAREHGTEPDGSHCILGLARWLLSDDPAAIVSRRDTTWLLIPILDVDAAARAEYRLGDVYTANAQPPMPEATSYATYLVHRLDAGGRVDMVVNLNNLECDEGGNLLDSVVDPAQKTLTIALNTELFAQAKREGYTTGKPAGWHTGQMPLRLSGWCAAHGGSLALIYELNACDPKSRLSLPRLQHLGAVLGQELSIFLHSPAFAPTASAITAQFAARRQAAAAWWPKVGHPVAARTAFDLFTMGY